MKGDPPCLAVVDSASGGFRYGVCLLPLGHEPTSEPHGHGNLSWGITGKTEPPPGATALVHWRRPLRGGGVEFRFEGGNRRLFGTCDDDAIEGLREIFESAAGVKLPEAEMRAPRPGRNTPGEVAVRAEVEKPTVGPSVAGPMVRAPVHLTCTVCGRVVGAGFVLAGERCGFVPVGEGLGCDGSMVRVSDPCESSAAHESGSGIK